MTSFKGLLTTLGLAAIVGSVGCARPPISFRGQTGSLAVRVVLEDSASGGYHIAATNKVLGDILTSCIFTIDGANLPAQVSKTISTPDWTNPDGSYKTVYTSFGQLLPGDVMITVSGVGSSNGKTILAGSTTVAIEANTTTTATVVASFLKGSVQLGLDPNSSVPSAN